MRLPIRSKNDFGPKLDNLLAEIKRRVFLIESDIKDEENRTRKFDSSDPTYPATARMLRLRRNNLVLTISILETKLAEA